MATRTGTDGMLYIINNYLFWEIEVSHGYIFYKIPEKKHVLKNKEKGTISYIYNVSSKNSCYEIAEDILFLTLPNEVI